MGQNHSNFWKLKLSTKLEENIICPICLWEFNDKTTYKDLNCCLFGCGNETEIN